MFLWCLQILFWLIVLIFLILIGCRIMTMVTCGNFKLTTQDLSGKVVVITGPTQGIGLETTKALASKGATVYLLCRNTSKGQEVANQLATKGYVISCHLDSLNSVRQAAKDLLAKCQHIDILINNAGMGSGGIAKPKMTEDGLEMVMATNYFGHFLLTLLLLPAIKKSSYSPARIINVSSMAYQWARGFSIETMNFQTVPKDYDYYLPYSYSKLALVLFSRELARKLQGTGVTVNVCHPGFVRTNIFWPEVRRDEIVRYIFASLTWFFKNPVEGAMTSLYLAASDEVKNVSGHYFADCGPRGTSVEALNDQMATEVFYESCKLVNISPDSVS